MGDKKNNKKKHIDHDPQSESSKAVFGEPKAKGDEFIPRTFK
ncbi:CPC_1213 family protein [Clostridium sardiniense]